MRFEVNGKQVFASTGGRQHKTDQDWIIFIHGAGGSHVVWNQQVRCFAYDGYNVLALDLPGHGDSEGEPLQSVEAIAAWIVDVMDALNITQAHLVNHSVGGPICLELAANNPNRVKSVAFVSAAMTIAVNDTLLEISETNPPNAYIFMNSGFFAKYGQLHDSSVPGSSLIGIGLRVMEHNRDIVLNTDLKVCAAYSHGAKAVANVRCPTLNLLAAKDAMVPLRSGKELGDALNDCTQHIFENSGHMLPMERPREINEQLRRFYRDRF